jgi:hypothetical protein
MLGVTRCNSTQAKKKARPKTGPTITEGSCTHLRQSPHPRLRSPQELPFLVWLATETRCGRAAPREL